MFKTILVNSLLLLSLNVFAQTIAFRAPDYATIEKEISDETSEYFYPDLLKRLKDFDTTMTQNQYEHLYFGYIFQKSYNPYHTFSEDEELTAYLRKEVRSDDYPEIIKLLDNALEEFPLDLSSMTYLGHFYRLSGEDEMSTKVETTVRNLMACIIRSGNGLQCESGFHVIAVGHEYLLLNMMGFQRQSQSLNGNCDYLKFEKGKYPVDGLYFNVGKLLEKEFELLK